MSEDHNKGSRVEAGMALDFAKAMSYGDYLQLDTLLAAQKPVSLAHDEMLFIVIHHVQELWLRQIIHELEFSLSAMEEDKVDLAFKALARVSRIQEQLISAWDVLSTMTPADYLKFRDDLGKASGFQSYQYRLVEILLGARDAKMLAVHRHRPEIHERLQAAFDGPGIYDAAIRILVRRGVDLPASLINRDYSKGHEFSPELRDAWLMIYRNPEKWFDLYQLAEELIDVEDWFQQWRFRHMKTVERIIGFKKGTGGSSGVKYLKTALDKSFFPELWDVRTHL